MRCTLSTWEVRSLFSKTVKIPCIVEVFPFDNDAPVIYDSDSPDRIPPIRCSFCHQLIDSYSQYTSDEKCTCAWCQTSFSVANVSRLQKSKNQFRLYSHIRRPYTKYFILFVLDLCCSPENFEMLRKCLVTALESLLPGTPFVVSLINKSYITYLFAVNGRIFTFDLNVQTTFCDHVNIVDNSNTHEDIPIIIDYINSLSTNNRRSQPGINDIIFQVGCDRNIYTQIVLFSPMGPTIAVKRNIILNWISTTTLSNREVRDMIDGYYLCIPRYKKRSNENLNPQILGLMHKITTTPPIFNISISAQVTETSNPTYFHKKVAGATPHFKASFEINASDSINPSLFGVEVKCTRFIDNKIVKEYFWSSQKFKKSESFITILAGIDPMVSIPIFADDSEVPFQISIKKFAERLLRDYRKELKNKMACPWYEPDSTFATMPHLQWYLRACYSGKPCTDRIFCERSSLFAMFYPRILFWESPDVLIRDYVPLDMQIYELAGQPPIVVYDTLFTIMLYSDFEIPIGSALFIYLKKIQEDRYPVPEVVHQSIETFRIFCATTSGQNSFKILADQLFYTKK